MRTKLLYLLLFICSYSYAQIPTTGLSANYEFTNGALTDAANAVTFTQTGTALTNINDRFTGANNAISLNGDHLIRTDVAYPGNNLGANYGNEGTVSFWIKTTTNDTNKRIIIDDSNNNSSLSSTTWTGYYVFLQDGKIGVSTRVLHSGNTSYRGSTNSTTPIISDGNWHHVTMTIGNTYNVSSSGLTVLIRTKTRVYIDGLDQGEVWISESGSSSFRLLGSHDTNGNFTVGNNRTNSLSDSNRFHGAVDDLNIYTRRVTQAEVTQLATINNFCFPPQASSVSVSNITETSAEVTWTESGNFDLAYVKKGEAFSNATILSNINYTANSAQNLISLQTSTIYNLYLRKPCSSSVNSAWSAPIEFRTNGITYVNKNATGTNDGTSWVNAYTDLQDAFTSLQDNGKIWVAQGTYTPDASNRSSHFAINKTNIKLYGGFVGSETALSQRDFRANATILSGDLLGDDAGAISGSVRTDNSYNVVKVNQNGTTIDGFTIRDGHATGSGDQAVGAAIFKKKIVTSITVKNCTIKNNVAYVAAGIFAEYTTSGVGTFDIESSTFDNNLARHSTSFSAWARTSGTYTFKVSNSLFTNNEAKDLSGSGNGYAASAGWLRAIGNTTTIVNASLINNTYAGNNDIGTNSSMSNFNRATVGVSKDNGGIINLEVANSIFWNNTITGGAIANSISGIHTTLGQVTVLNSIDQDSFSRLPAANLTNTSNTDPLFTGASDFTLQSTSPAINFGINSYLPTTITTDLSGNDRISIATIDAGAYEYQCNNCLGISINKVGNGTVTQSSGPVYNNGDSVTLTATNVAGWEFVEWSGDITGTTNPITFTINSNLNITATFSKVPTYVNKNATGNNDGTSWTDAFTDLQNVLLNTVDDAEIWVAAGTYTSSTTNNRSTSFNIVNKGVKVYGGFIGTETQLDQRDFINNKTILSGDINGDDTGVSFTGNNRGENMHHVVRINANDVILDGLIINDGQADTTINGEIDYAGAVYVGDVVNGFTIKNSEFNNNVGVKGGAIRAYFANNAAVVIENSIFNNNLSQYGSGAYILANNNSIVTVSITNSLFTNNTSADVNSSAKGFTGSSLWIRANGVNSSMTTNINNVTFAKNNDIGTQSNTGRGTLGLSRRTDDNSTHNVTVNNTIFYHNVGVNGVTATSINQGHTSIASITNINNTIDEDNFSIYNSTSNFNNISSTDPQFKDVANNDFTLNTGSPAIDAGDNTKVASNNTKDLLGNVRIFNSTVDMGPYESTAIIQRTLTINEINGTISVNPNPNSFSGNSGTYDDGTSVELTATPDSGYQFDGWSGDATGATNPLTITMDTDKTVTAIFSLIQRTLTINATNGGVTTNPNPTNGTYANGASVELTATPDSGYQFDGWSGDATGITNPLTITMDANKTVTAIFSRIQRTLTINEINGTISVNPNPNSFNGNSGTYDDGTSVELTATPDSGYQFDGWSGDATGTTNPLTITMNSDKTVTANFSLIERTLTINAVNGNVTTNPNPTNGKYVNGTSVELTATPNVGYQFDGWSGDVTGTTNPLTITMDSDKTITANFSQIQHTLTINIIGTGTLDVASGSIYNHGELVTLTATPGTNFTVREWTGDVIAGAVTSVQVTMDADKTVSVEFESTLNIKDVDKIQGLKMFPNPTKGDLILDFQEQVKAIELYNLQGKIIKKFITKIIDISSVSNGVYVLKITTKNGKIAVKRVIKN